MLGGVWLLPPPVISCLEVIFQVNRQKRLGGDSLRAAALQVLYFLLLYGTLYCLLIAAVKHLAAWDTGGVLRWSWAERWFLQACVCRAEEARNLVISGIFDLFSTKELFKAIACLSLDLTRPCSEIALAEAGRRGFGKQIDQPRVTSRGGKAHPAQATERESLPLTEQTK